MKQVMIGLLFSCALAQADMGGTDGTDRAPTTAKAQSMATPEFSSRAQVSFELLGSGLLYSVYGSYRFMDMLAANVGISYWTADVTTSTSIASYKFLLFPVSMSLLLGDISHNFEIMAGALISSVSSTGVSVGTTTSDKFANAGLIPNFGIGYRYWPKDGGFHFRLMLEAFVASSSFLPWGGLSFGYAF